MGKFYLIICACFLSVSAIGQIDTSGNVNFTKAKFSGKLIFIELQTSVYRKTDIKNFKRYSPLATIETAKFLSKNFSCFRYFLGDSLTSFLFAKQKPKILPTYYIFDADSNLLHSSFGINKSVMDFQLMKDSALMSAQGLRELMIYKDKWAKNSLSKNEIRKFIELKLLLKQYDNGELIEKFASEMDDADTENPEILLLIMKSGPFYSGLASKKAVTDKELYNTIYRKEYFNYYPWFDQRALANSMAYATKTKNLEMIQDVARSYQYRHNKNDYDKEPYSPWVMMNYYKATKDTSSFLDYLIKYNDKYLLVTPDSSKKFEAKAIEKINSEAKNNVGRKNGSVVSINTKDYFANRLSNGANQILWYKRKDPFYLNKAIVYCRHALLLSPDYFSAKAILAQLLYRSGFAAEAEKLQQEVLCMPNLPEAFRLRYEHVLEEIRDTDVE